MSRLTVRRPRVDLAACDLSGSWVGGDAFRTQVFNTLSFGFPIGERFFIDSVRQALPHVRDSRLQEEIRLFIAQEATHSTLHRVFNERLEAAGLRNLVEPIVGVRVRMSETYSVLNKLAITMAYENFTAALGDALLRNQDWLEGAAEPLRVLWLWHAIEEGEHRAVAFDVYMALGGGNARRIAWFLYVSLLFLLDSTLQTLANLWRQRQLHRLGTWGSALRFLFGRRGVVAAVLPAWVAYLRPSFHPDQRGEAELMARWLEENRAWFSADSYALA